MIKSRRMGRAADIIMGETKELLVEKDVGRLIILR
jgi:hypothetical protein